MDMNIVLDSYVEALIEGNRKVARDIVRKVLSTGIKSEEVYRNLLFPAMERIDICYRESEISFLVRNVAIRINRFLTDQVQSQLLPRESTGKSAIIICAEAEAEELGGQMCADLLEAAGWDCYFLGGGVPDDEISEFIGKVDPSALVIYGSTPSGVPLTRKLIERIREIGACPLMNVIVTGGIYNRVEGLWEEIQADYYASDPVEVLEVASSANQKLHLPKDSRAPKKRRKLVEAIA